MDGLFLSEQEEYGLRETLQSIADVGITMLPADAALLAELNSEYDIFAREVEYLAALDYGSNPNLF